MVYTLYKLYKCKRHIKNVFYMIKVERFFNLNQF